jgi:Dolichyl-phosphate-mannose-protein mannosyltransferase
MRASALPTAATGYALALLAGLASLWVTGAWNAGFSGADEPAHFLNAWFVALYAREALGQNPLAYATEFYLHYPKLSIGHWPPAYYGMIAPAFWILPATSKTALAVNLLVCALPGAGVASLLHRLAGRAAALAGAALWALAPLSLEGFAFFMLDQPLAACAFAAAMAWAVFRNRRRLFYVVLFSCLTALAILIKGNGWLLVFVPPLHIALTGEWRMLRDWRVWAAAALGALLVGPWYAATAGISADGFNYSPGPAYAAHALLFNFEALAANLGLALPLVAWGIAAEWRRRRDDALRWSLVAACLALLLATLILQSLVPVDLDARYMAPAMPGCAVLAVLGGLALLERLPRAAAAAGLLLLVPGVLHLADREPKVGLRMDEASAGAEGAWLVDGGSAAEGAFTAAMAVRDPALRDYAVRGSKLLAESDFMGRGYRSRFSKPEPVLGELRRLGIGGVVIAGRPDVPPMPHTALLRDAVRSPGSGYRLAAVLPFRGRPGATEVYRADGPARPNAAAIRALGLPEKLVRAESRR